MAGRRQISNASGGAPPTKGINDTDPLANMDPSFCVSMLNIFPDNAALSLRHGFQEYATGLGASVTRVMDYKAQDGTTEMFAVTAAGIYDITGGTNPLYPAAPTLVHALTNGRVSTTQITNTGGAYLIAANGVDAAAFYNGTAWAPFVADATPVNPGEIDGLAPTSILGPVVHKGRLWVVEKDSMSAWYFPTDAIAGTLTEFPLSGVFRTGGKLVELSTWSLDTGAGMDDMLVFRSSTGEIAVYSGNDPDVATEWMLVAVYYVSSPVGNVSSVDLGGDVVMLTRAGLIPLSKVVQGAAQESLFESALSRNISKTLNRLVNNRSASEQSEWELHNLPTLQMLMVLIPEGSTTTAVQYVMNTTTGAWTSYNLPATCGCLTDGLFYFGTTDGRVCKYTSDSTTLKDDVKLDGTGGSVVSGEFLTAFTYLGDATKLKHFKLVRPTIQSLTSPQVSVTLNVDFDTADGALYAAPTVGIGQTDNWDAGIWDTAVWSNTNSVFRPWASVMGIGFSAALRVKLTNISTTTVASLEVVYETGGIV